MSTQVHATFSAHDIAYRRLKNQPSKMGVNSRTLRQLNTGFNCLNASIQFFPWEGGSVNLSSLTVSEFSILKFPLPFNCPGKYC